MSKIDFYRKELRGAGDWDTYLVESSGLPGRRANIELARACALEGDRPLFDRYLTYRANIAPVNTPEEFLAFCGVLGYGRLLSEGDYGLFAALRNCANDPRWRIREGVALGLQMQGGVNMDRLIKEMRQWSAGTALERRAAAAGLCEPGLLAEERHGRQTLKILDAITVSISDEQERRTDEFLALRKGMGYCWSVAVAANPQAGKPVFEKWLGSDDPDVQWILKENLKKKRLTRMDAAWVDACRAQP